MDHRTPLALTLAAVGLCTSSLLTAPASADHPRHLYALEVFGPHGAPVTQAPCGRQVAIPGMADAADLPTGTTAAISLEGPLQRVRGTNRCRTWWIGGVPVAAPYSAKPTARPGTIVRVVASAAVAPTTKIVASRIRVRPETGFGPAEVELAYLAPFTIVAGDTVVDNPVTGDCVTVEEAVWSVREQGAEGRLWDLDVAAARSAGEVEPCFREGDAIEAELALAPPAAD